MAESIRFAFIMAGVLCMMRIAPFLLDIVMAQRNCESNCKTARLTARVGSSDSAPHGWLGWDHLILPASCLLDGGPLLFLQFFRVKTLSSKDGDILSMQLISVIIDAQQIQGQDTFVIKIFYFLFGNF